MPKATFFLNIGLPKTGTTWLYDVLNHHSDVQLPYDKEIRYFWVKEHLPSMDISQFLFNNHWHFKEKRYLFLYNLLQSTRPLLKLKKVDKKRIQWYFNYFFGSKNDQWYFDLFPENQATGDITPKYCELSKHSIKYIKSILPDAQLILILRDPIEREWSRTKMNLLKKRGKSNIHDIDENLVFKHFEDPHQLQSNDYTYLIQKWLTYFSKDQLLIIYFDEIQKDAHSVYQKVCQFLNIEAIDLPQINQKSNKGVEQEIPDKYLYRLVELNYRYIEKFYKHHPNDYSKIWLERYQLISKGLDKI